MAISTIKKYTVAVPRVLFNITEFFLLQTGIQSVSLRGDQTGFADLQKCK